MVGEYTTAGLNVKLQKLFNEETNITLHETNIPITQWFLDEINLKTLILMFHNSPHRLWIQHKRLQISDSDIDSFNKSYSEMRLNSYSTADYNICIWHISNGYTKIKALDPSYEEISTATKILTKDKKHVIKVIKTNDNTIHILTSKYDWDMARKILALIPKFFPDLEKPELNQLLIKLGMGDLDKAEEIVNKLFDETKLLNNLLDKQFEQLKYTLSYSQIAKYEKSIEAEISSINELEKTIARRYTTIAAYNREIFAIKSQGNESVDELIAYLERHKLLNIKDVGESTLTLRIITPIKYFDPDVIRRYMNRSVQYITDTPLRQYILDRLFTLMDLELITYTDVRIDLKDNYIDRNAVADNDPNLPLPHPHLMGYNCWGQNLSYITKSLSEKDYIMACEQIIAATYNISLTDTTVLGRFMQTMASADRRKAKSFRIKSTNELLSYDDLLKIYNKGGDTNEANNTN